MPTTSPQQQLNTITSKALSHKYNEEQINSSIFQEHTQDNLKIESKRRVLGSINMTIYANNFPSNSKVVQTH